MGKYNVLVIASKIVKVDADNRNQAEALVDAQINDHYKLIPQYFSILDISVVDEGN